MKSKVTAGFGTIFAFLISFAAWATSVRSVNIQELVLDSKNIVKVKVLSKDTALDSQESGRIVTYYTFEVKEWLKGTPSKDNQMVIKQIGQGEYTVNGYRIRQNLYFPEYEIGKIYVLFLPEAHSRTGLLAPLGLSQGVFEVQTLNGKEVLPELRTRQKRLQSGIIRNTKTKKLLLKLEASKNDDSYEHFKSMIQTAGDAQ